MVGLVMALFWVVPPGAAYWMFHLPEPPPQEKGVVVGQTGHLVSVAAIVAMLLLFAAAGLVAGAFAEHRYWGAIIGLAYLPQVLGFAFWAARVKFPPRGRLPQPGVQEAPNGRPWSPAADARAKYIVSLEDDRLVRGDQARNWLSAMLRTALAATLAMCAFGLIDSAGQMLYTLHFCVEGPLLGGVYGALLAAAPVAHWVTTSLLADKKDRPLPISLNLLAGAGAALVIITALTGLDMFSHAIAYGFQFPADPPAAVMCAEFGTLDGKMTLEGSRRGLRPLASALLIAALFSFFVGGSRRRRASSGATVFLNRTSLHPIYTSRLILAYLGASNKIRYGDTMGVNEVLSGDDISQERYWFAPEKFFYPNGAPVHLVNMTLSETIGGESQIKQGDGKGLGMSLGPAGLSVGVRHHAVLPRTHRPAKHQG